VSLDLNEAYARDGVVCLPGALDAVSLATAQAAWSWSLANPGPLASRIPSRNSDALFYQDLYNPDVLTGYRAMLEASPLPSFVSALWGGGPCWFMYEQVFLKEGGEARRTPWHQDSSYLAVAGDQLAVAWITFDPCAKADSLEFVPGSHRGRLYNGSRFDINDDTLPTHPRSSLPVLPDIEADRDGWEIVSFAVEPGDVVIFHPKVLHGGAPTHPGTRRRTLTLRFFGEDAVYEPREGGAGPRVAGFHERMTAGQAFRHPSFLKLA
jgi:ectoine hydroxylase-related dioxygenase (phytanoyl-CoA dioxygenase family)